MALTTQQRRDLFRQFATIYDDPSTPATLTKADLIAAVGGVDDYLEANAAAMNSAIPQPARGALTTSQKARLLAAVALARWGG